MAKRFTDSDKWQDKWFRRLPPDQKLGYMYILDRCDMAGTIELDPELAEFHIGCPVDWEGLVKGSDTRLVPLANGRLWVRKFIGFQHGQLSAGCNAHRTALQLVERYQLPVSNEIKEKPSKGTGRVPEGYSKGPGNSNSNGNSKGNGRKKGGVGENTGAWVIPERFDTERVRHLLDDFAAMRRQIGKPIKDLGNTSRILDKFDSVEHLEFAIEFCIANEYQGLKPDYRPPAKKDGGGQAYIPPSERKRDAKLDFELQRTRLVKKARSENWSEERLRAAIDNIRQHEATA